MKKIAMLTTGPYVANGIGGIETMITAKYNWLLKNGYEVGVFNYCPAIPKRKKEVQEIVTYKYKSYDWTMAAELVAEIDKFDAVIFEKEATVQCGFNFHNLNILYHEIWKKISTKKFLWQHNGLARSLNKFPYVLGFINEADGIIHLSPESEYVQDMVLKFPNKQDRCFRSTVFTDFSEFENIDRNGFERKNRLVYIGRPVSIKEPYRLLDMAPYLKEKGIDSEIHGADSSMAGLNYVLTRPNAIDCVRKNGKQDGITKCYGPYKREDGLDLLKHSLFGCNFFNYRKKGIGTYGDRLECTMHEIICCGAIPVFDKHFAENCKTFFTKQRYIDIPNFAVWSDPTPEGFEKTSSELAEIANNPELQAKYRETGYKILKENFDINIHMPLLLEFMEKTTKDNTKFKSEREIVEYFSQSKEYGELFEKTMNEGYLMHMSPSTVCKKIVCSLPERTNRKFIEHYRLN